MSSRPPTVDLDALEIDFSALQHVPREACERHRVFPVSRSGTTLIVAMAEPPNIFAQDDFRFLTGCDLELVYAPADAIQRAIERAYSSIPELVPEKPTLLSRDQLLAEVARSLRATHPDRADVLLREIERLPIRTTSWRTASCPHCRSPVTYPGDAESGT